MSAARRRRVQRRSSERRGRRLSAEGTAQIVLALLVIAVPLVFVPGAKDAFRLPKLGVAGALALASLLPLSLRLRRLETITWGAIWSLPAVRAVVPLVAVAFLGLAVTAHPAPVRQALADLAIAAAALVGWSAGMSSERLARLLRLVLLPATLLAALAVLQFHGLFRPFAFASGEEATRLGITALAGNTGDLAGLLAFAALLAQLEIARRRGGWRVAAAVSLILGVYALVITQTITALLALGAGACLFWFLVLPRRRVMAALGALAVAGAILVLAVAPLRERLTEKGGELVRGDVNVFLTGRLDGWRAAGAMAASHPVLGVGHGTFRSEFAAAKVALAGREVPFYEFHTAPMFVNAHNEYLEVAAETGVLGLLALAWGVWVLLGVARRIGRGSPGAAGEGEPRLDRAFAWAGLAVWGVLAAAHFPFRIALTAYPALLFLAWLFARAGSGSSSVEESA